MSTAQANLSMTWKQEVNRRIAEHRNRKGQSTADESAGSDAHRAAGSHRAAEAAARVAARFAKAPSYSEMLTEEARAAVRAAEYASRAALHAHAAAKTVLAGLEAASTAAAGAEGLGAVARQPAPVFESGLAVVHREAVEQESARRAEGPGTVHAPGSFEARADGDPEEKVFDEEAEAWRQSQIADAGLPHHANLIEFPRELVATRKVRPRIAEGPLGGMREPGAQLSIFEVDPETVSTEPAAVEGADADRAPVWTQPEWSGIELEAQPAEPMAVVAPAVTAQEANAEPALALAPMSRRLLAAVVDSALIAAALVAALYAAAANAKALPGLREMELVGAGALLVVAGVYQVLFSTLARATPGMKYARLRLSTFEGERPTRAQRTRRLGALMLSVLPVGLGLVWAVFDEDRLSWHDRLSQTYLREG
ncbi:MAG TPA: RDD family protein [Terracidiphilus sp.]|nr:RDD family protein [Terracidiphilus sp.]